MEETEDDVDSNLILSSAKKLKSKSSKNNCILKKSKYQSKEKFHMDSIQKMFNQGITSNKPVKMIFTSNNIIKPLPILSSGSKNNNDDYLIISDEMKINKNIFESNLFNLLQKERNKKKFSNRNLFSSFFKREFNKPIKKRER